MEALGWRKSLSDFSEIDTSDIATDLSELPGFDDLKEIISNESSLDLTNTDYMNQNFFQRKIEESDVISVILPGDIASEIEVATTVEKTNTRKTKAEMKRRKQFEGFPCIVCKKVFPEKKEMKDHVLKTHLRPTVICRDCGKRVFQDKILHHKKNVCSVLAKQCM